MTLKPVPFQSEAFLNHKQYTEARREFYVNEYGGKVVAFNHEVVSISGSTRQPQGKLVKIYDIGHDWLKVTDLKGEVIEGLWNPDIFSEPMAMRVYRAIVLVDEPGNPDHHYATKVEKRIKQIETRMRDIIPEGDIVICCGSKSMTANRLKALCIVYAAKGRPMTPADEEKACIECVPKRIAYDLSNWRYFSRKFEFAPQYIEGSYQGTFWIRIPDDVQILG